MKPATHNYHFLFGKQIWIRLSFLLLLGLTVPTSTSIFAGIPSSTLNELLTPGTSIESVDGSVVFNDFFLAIGQYGMSAPNPTEIMAEVITPAGSDDIILQFRIHGASQIMQWDNAYELEIGFQAHARTGNMVFSNVSLDINGATLGTTGTGFVQIHTDITSIEVPKFSDIITNVIPANIAILDVQDDGDGEQLFFDSASIVPGLQSLQVSTTVGVYGGNDSHSGAVLTDFQYGFIRTEAIPEPISLLLAGLILAVWTFFPLSRKGWCPQT
ncbi:MAG: hypothetical protein JW829_02410 [Pirellulales bacterium]|nr:hypothetical protein [Pirellulales bacterium]